MKDIVIRKAVKSDLRYMAYLLRTEMRKEHHKEKWTEKTAKKEPDTALTQTLANYGVDKEALAKVEKSIAAAERDAGAQQQKLAQLQGFEAMKAQLEGDERAIRTKLEVLAKIAEGRTDPSRIMLQISQAMPDQLWLTDLKVAAEEISFTGQTPSYAQVSDFLKSIASSSFFSDIVLKGIEENLGTSRDVRIQDFTIMAKRKAAQ